MATNKYIVIQKISDSDANMWGADGKFYRLLLKNNHSRTKSTDTTNFSDVNFYHCFIKLSHAEQVLKFLKSINPTHNFSIKTISK